MFYCNLCPVFNLTAALFFVPFLSNSTFSNEGWRYDYRNGLKCFIFFFFFCIVYLCCVSRQWSVFACFRMVLLDFMCRTVVNKSNGVSCVLFTNNKLYSRSRYSSLRRRRCITHNKNGFALFHFIHILILILIPLHFKVLKSKQQKICLNTSVFV